MKVMTMITSDRFVKLGERAKLDKVQATRDFDGITWTTRSMVTKRGVTYKTTITECSCPGGQNHGFCKHRARVIALVRAEHLALLADELWDDMEGVCTPAESQLMQAWTHTMLAIYELTMADQMEDEAVDG